MIIPPHDQNCQPKAWGDKMARKKTGKPVSKSQPDDEDVVLSLNTDVSPDEIKARIDATLNRLHAEANPPGRSSPSFVVRFPEDGMRERLAHMAKKNNRSANAEIIDRLQRSMIGDTVANLEETVAWLSEQIKRLEERIRKLER
jgi:hypothetical protein